jgi:hypothetical protein
MQERNLGAQILRHGWTLGFVFRIKPVTKSPAGSIKNHNDFITGIFFRQAPQHVGHPEYRPGRQIIRRAQVRQGMKSPVQETGGVNENTRVLGHDLGLVCEFPS